MLKVLIKNSRHDRKAFTLIELLVVIAIIGLLSTIAVASLSSSREKARIAKGQQFSGSIRSGMGYNIVGEWNFNDGSGTTAKDTSGYDNDGTIAGGVNWIIDEEQCMNDTCLWFDGVDDYVDCGNDASLRNINKEFTAEFWINLNSNIWPTIIGKGSEHTNGWRFYIHETSDTLVFAYQDVGGAKHWTVSTDLTRDAWQHIAISFSLSNSAIKLYRDSVNVRNSVDTVEINTNNAGFRIGSSGFTGYIDEVRVYDTALTLGQIQQNYAEGLERHRDLAMAE